MHPFRFELRSMLRLAVPVVISEIGWVSMSMVDTLMVGRVSPQAIGAVSIGSSVYIVVPLVGVGLLLGLDYLIAHAFGAGNIEDCHRSLFHGIYLSFALSIPLTLVLWLLIRLLPSFGLNPAVTALSIDYLTIVSWSVLPLLLYATFRRYMQAINLVTPIMFTLLSANLINAVSNWILVFGKWGFPRMGSTGAAYATLISKIYLFAGLFGFVVHHAWKHQTGLFRASLRLEFNRIVTLLKLGYPVALQLLLEVGVFATATLIAGTLRAVDLAAHQIVLKMASFTFMVPLGISSAGAVRVGQNLGAGRPHAAVRSGWIALAMGAGFMSIAALTFIGVPRLLMRLFTNDAIVIELGISLLLIAALFQIFDGVQVIATGILRGTGETRSPMISNLIGHWFLGLPVGIWLCFRLEMGIQGLWIGLCLGLMAVALALLIVWISTVRKIIRSS